jgi:hypothetical protein
MCQNNWAKMSSVVAPEPDFLPDILAQLSDRLVATLI